MNNVFKSVQNTKYHCHRVCFIYTPTGGDTCICIEMGTHTVGWKEASHKCWENLWDNIIMYIVFNLSDSEYITVKLIC